MPSYRTEAAFAHALRRAWARWPGGPGGQPQCWWERQEDALARGRPDLLIADTRDGTVIRIELKVFRWPLGHLPRTLGLRPHQAAFLWRWGRAGGRGGVLAHATTWDRWFWLPVQREPSWAQVIVKPLVWLQLPHVYGTGPVPIPPLLTRLPNDGTLIQCQRVPDAIPPADHWRWYVPYPPRQEGLLTDPHPPDYWVKRRANDRADPEVFAVWSRPTASAPRRTRARLIAACSRLADQSPDALPPKFSRSGAHPRSHRRRRGQPPAGPDYGPP